MSLLTDLVLRLHGLNNVELERLARELERIRVLASKDVPSEPVNVYQGGNPQYVSLGGETNDIDLWSGADLIIYSDTGTTEKGRWDGATGNITTAGTVDGVDVAGANAAQYVTIALNGNIANERVITAGEGVDLTDGGAGSTITVSGEDATTTNKGIASFVTTDFTVSSGAVTIKESGVDHGGLGGLSDNDHTQYILHSLADAANDFLVASGDDAFVKKTLAETGAILEGDIDHGNLQGLDTGADHSYIDQDVQTSASPTFAGIVIADGGTVGQAAGPLLTFDDTNNFLEITGCKVGLLTNAPAATLDIRGTLAETSGNAYSLRIAPTLAPASNGTTVFRPLYSQSIYSGNNNASQAIGFTGDLVITGTPTLTNIVGAYFRATMTAAATISNAAIGVQIDAIANGGGSILKSAGILVANQTAATNNSQLVLGTGTIPTGNFGIYNVSAYDNYFAGNVGIGIAASLLGKAHIDQTSSTGAIPVLFLDQGDVSEQCIKFSSDAADRDINLFTVNVTGAPKMWWDESEDAFSLTKGMAVVGTLVGGEATKQTNATNLQIGGDWTFKETTAPTADNNYGKMWTNTSNELWFQDGAGANHLLHGDAFSEIWFHGAAAVVVTISTEDAFTLVDSFAVVGHEDDSSNVVGNISTDTLTLSARGGGEYEISYHASITTTGASKEVMACVGIVLATAKDITDVTDDTVSPIVITSVAHGLNNGDMVEIAGVLVNTAANGSFIVANKAADTFEIVALDGTATTGNGDFDEGSPTGDVTIWYQGNMVTRRTVSQTSLGAISATGLHVLQNSDVLSLYIANLDDTSNINIYAVSLDANRIGD